jgi:16S rRNA (cytosine967-C5)-methyltransferase
VDFTKSFLENALLPPPVFLRTNTLKTDMDKLVEELKSQGVLAQNIGENALILPQSSGSVEKMDSYKKGLFFVQDLSCQKAVEMLDIKENSRVLDLCAAPGGKSFSASMFAPKGEIVACDLYEQRAGLIAKGAKRLGIEDITPKAADATAFNGSLGEFDRIICDVPCSGLGVIRRKPDIKYKNQTDFEELISIQRKILSNADNYLKVGGKLLYSTCTLNKKENRENVDVFLKGHPNYSIIQEHTFSPLADNTDGFYAAVLIKG